MRIVLTLLLVTLACTGPLLAATLADDPALSAEVTLAIKGETLPDIMGEIEKQTGVSLKVSTAIAEQKATVFVDEKPVREVMERLAVLFRLRWRVSESKGKRAYELYQDLKTRMEPEEQWKKALSQAMKEMDAEVRRKTAIKAADDRLQPIRDAYRAVVLKGAPLDPYIAAYNRIENDEDRQVLRGEAAVARLYCSLPGTILDSIRAGMTVCYDSQSPEPEWQLPQDVTDELLKITDWDHYGWSGEPVGVNVQIYMSVGTSAVDLSAKAQARFADGAPCSAGQSLFYKRVVNMIPTSEVYLPHDPEDKALDDKVSISMKELVDEAVILGMLASSPRLAANRSDILALLHRKLGLQIISDYYSDWQSWTPAKDSLVRHILDGFMTGRSMSWRGLSGRWAEDFDGGRDCNAAWGWDGQYLYMRISDSPLADAAEIPNRQIRGWRTHFADHGSFGLYELAEMAAMTETRTQALYRNWGFFGLGDEDHSNLVDRGVVPALRLYGLMSARQRSLAFTGSVGVSSFTSEQADALRKVCESSIADGGQARAALITRTPTLPANERPVVGIYSKGVRVDKPEPSDEPLPPQPVSVSMRQAGMEEAFWYVKSLNEYSYRSPLKDAHTVDEALTMARKDQPGTKITDIVRELATKYTMSITFQDGTVSEIPIRISGFTRQRDAGSPKVE